MIIDHRTGERRSRRYHGVVAQRLERDPTILARALARVSHWLEHGDVARYYAQGWQQILTSPVQALKAFLVEDSERARAFRQVSPFAGTLDPRERWQLWRAERSEHDAPAA